MRRRVCVLESLARFKNACRIYGPGAFPNAEAATGEVLSLPIFPQLTDGEVKQVINLVRIFFAVR